MRKTVLIVMIALALLAAGAYFVLQAAGDAARAEEQRHPVGTELIRVERPRPDTSVSSPLTVEGEARGQWYFEASFPVVLVNWDGLIIAEAVAEARDDWMTDEFVPFTATLEFSSPYEEGDPEFMSRGTVILMKANPSGLPENDDAVEVQVVFAGQ